MYCAYEMGYWGIEAMSRFYTIFIFIYIMLSVYCKTLQGDVLKKKRTTEIKKP